MGAAAVSLLSAAASAALTYAGVAGRAVPHGGVHGAGDPGPPGDRGPVNSSAGAPSGPAGAAMQMASVAIPVPANPASRTACALASVAVTTALTKAASASGTGTETMTLIVPGPAGPS